MTACIVSLLLLTRLFSVWSVTTIPRLLICVPLFWPLLTTILQHAAANFLVPKSAGGISSRGEQMDQTCDSDVEPDRKQAVGVY